MNAEVIKSWLFKLLPVALAILATKGWITADQSAQAQPMIESVIAAATLVYGFVRSFQTHKS